ncbi:MAG TPA: sensor domain-containing protein [Micromonosporaceae bacterium]|nr:sensor domain-containing protein [Micromonosporaceae bacterium]
MATTLTDTAGPARPGFIRQLGIDTWYALSGLPVATVAFAVLVTGFCAGAGLLVTLIGLPVLAATMYAARGFADVHRLALRRVVNRPSPRPRYLRSRPGDGWIRRTLTSLRDPQSWLDLIAGMFVDFPLAIVAFVVTVTWWAVAFAGLTDVFYEWAVPHGPDNHSLAWVLGFHDTLTNRVTLNTAVGVVFALTLVPVVRGVALMRAWASRGLLCGIAEMRQHIAGLEERTANLADRNRAAASAEADALRRLERDIHDGPQQRLVRLAMDLGRARAQMETDPEAARATIDEALGQTRETLDELRALSRGIAPPILTDRGLPSALAALAARSPVPVDLAVADDLGRLAPIVESTAYFVAAETLTNVAKHSAATAATVTVARGPDRLGIIVADNGMGGASVAKGHGLAGLADRVRAAGGTLAVFSPVGGPTEIRAEVPCA